MKVRLKPKKFTMIFIALAKFQFHEGPIKTLPSYTILLDL